MDKRRLSRVIEEKERELLLINKRLNSLLLVSDKINQKATGIEISNIVNNNPAFPKIILENINLQQIGYTRIIENTSVDSRLLLDRLTEFIDVYAGSKRYLKRKITELQLFLDK